MRTLLACVLLLVPASAAAQAAASTLYRLTRSANAIAEVKVLAVRAGQGRWQVVFKTLGALKGSPPDTFTLEEVEGRMCGSTLYGLVPGSGLLAFLEHDAAAAAAAAAAVTRLAVPSPRALLPLHAEVRDHVTALLRGGSTVEHLTKALSSRHPRVRHDAACALPLLPDLAAASGADRDRILAALRIAMAAGDNQSPGLIRAAQRLSLPAAVDILLPHCLAPRQHGLEPLLVEAIAAIDGEAAARRLLPQMPARPQQQRAAVRLLARCGGREARRCLERLLVLARDGVRIQAATALLDLGQPADDIRERAGAGVLASAQQLRQGAPRFRSIRPGTRDE